MGYAEAIEQQMVTLHEHELMWQWITQEERTHAESSLTVLRSGDPYFVNAAIADMLGASAKTLPDASWRPEDLPSLQGWCYLEKPQPLPVLVSDPGDRPLDRLQAVTWLALSNGIAISLFGPPRRDLGNRGADIFCSGFLGYGVRLHDTAANAGYIQDAALFGESFLYALFQFMRQRILTVSAHPIANRQARRRLARALDREPIVNVIQLRRREYQQRDESHDTHVEYTCQWLVRGHWRQQYFPTSGEHRPLWIAPHVKGPSDKPLKTHKLTAYEVVR